jgi:hypothetical protein
MAKKTKVKWRQRYSFYFYGLIVSLIDKSVKIILAFPLRST